jgi:hypothetical protein
VKVAIGNFILCPGGRDSDEEPETTAAQAAQVASALRARDARVFRRGNRVFTFTFTKTLEHSSFQAAERHRVLHPAEIPSTGVLSFVTEAPGGGESTLWFTSHNLDQVRIRQVGVSTITTYTITAAGPTTTRPV